ncbi:hypothetical protein GE09DRAFT_459326 [Coniochaeta sp. 2T2.1]|nr:hypothetical protein GE09DRAFT_459326 [Coniochaeta sp. 2T2.1]
MPTRRRRTVSAPRRRVCPTSLRRRWRLWRSVRRLSCCARRASWRRGPAASTGRGRSLRRGTGSRVLFLEGFRDDDGIFLHGSGKPAPGSLGCVGCVLRCPVDADAGSDSARVAGTGRVRGGCLRRTVFRMFVGVHEGAFRSTTDSICNSTHEVTLVSGGFFDSVSGIPPRTSNGGLRLCGDRLTLNRVIGVLQGSFQLLDLHEDLAQDRGTVRLSFFTRIEGSDVVRCPLMFQIQTVEDDSPEVGEVVEGCSDGDTLEDLEDLHEDLRIGGCPSDDLDSIVYLANEGSGVRALFIGSFEALAARCAFLPQKDVTLDGFLDEGGRLVNEGSAVSACEGLGELFEDLRVIHRRGGLSPEPASGADLLSI